MDNSGAQRISEVLRGLDSFEIARVMQHLREMIDLLEPDEHSPTDLRLRTYIETLLTGYELGSGT